MGNYTAFHFEFKLKPHTPKKIVEFFDLLYLVDEDKTPDDERDNKLNQLKKELNAEFFHGALHNDLSSHIYGASAYHESWCVRMKLEDGTYRSFASTKRDDVEMLVKFFLILLPYLEVKDGDILVRYTHESGVRDYIIFVDTANNAVGTGQGISYSTNHGYLNDSRSPSHSNEGDDIYIPVMNRHELIALGLIKNPAAEYYLLEGECRVIQRIESRPKVSG